MANQRYRLFLLNSLGNEGFGVVDMAANSSAELPHVINWKGRYFVRTGSYSYTYHEQSCLTAEDADVTSLFWRVPRRLGMETA